MKKTTKKTRKWLSMLLAVILTVGIIPANVIAEDGQTLDMTLPECWRRILKLYNSLFN